MSRPNANLYDETVDFLKYSNFQPKDVLWVGSADGEYSLSWEDFAKLAKETNYYSGYGVQEVSGALVVVGNGWWLERHEYDGAERWVLKAAPKLIDAPKPYDTVLVVEGGFFGKGEDEDV